MKQRINKRFRQRAARLYAPLMRRAGPLCDAIGGRCRRYLTREMSVLELGCGSGQLTFRLAGTAGRWEATAFFGADGRGGGKSTACFACRKPCSNGKDREAHEA